MYVVHFVANSRSVSSSLSSEEDSPLLIWSLTTFHPPRIFIWPMEFFSFRWSSVKTSCQYTGCIQQRTIHIFQSQQAAISFSSIFNFLYPSFPCLFVHLSSSSFRFFRHHYMRQRLDSFQFLTGCHHIGLKLLMNSILADLLRVQLQCLDLGICTTHNF